MCFAEVICFLTNNCYLNFSSRTTVKMESIYMLNQKLQQIKNFCNDETFKKGNLFPNF